MLKRAVRSKAVLLEVVINILPTHNSVVTNANKIEVRQDNFRMILMNQSPRPSYQREPVSDFYQYPWT